jgi:tetratricopeptide (TPR) repeat protein
MFRGTACLRGLLLSGLFFLAIVMLLPSCRSQVDPYALELSPKEYFQRGIEASDRNDYKTAMKYYDAYLQRYPWRPDEVENLELLNGNLWARYEIAFAYYKLKKDRTAVELFEELLDRYDSLQEREDIDPNVITQGPLILTDLVLEKIRNRNPRALETPELPTTP